MSDLKTNLEQILQEKQTKIIPENIKKNVEIFGITGTLEAEINTSDATATADDIINPKTAYVNGEKITGNIATTQISLETNVESETIPDTIIGSFNILYGLSEDREYLFIFENNGSQNATSNTWELKVYKKEANSYILNTTFTRENLDIDIGAYLISIGPWGLFNDDNKLLICVKHSGYNSTIFGIVYDKLSNTITMPHSISLGEFNAYGWSNANPIYPDIVANSCRISRYTETGVKNIYRNDTSYNKPYAFEGITQWSCNGEVFTIFKKNGSGTVRYFIKNYQAVKSVTTSEYVCLNTTGDYAFVDGVLKSSIVNTETGDISFEDVGTEIVAESKIIIWLDRFIYIVLTNTNNTKKDTKYSYNVYVFNESDKSTYNVGQIGFIQENDTNFGAISWGQFNKGFIGLGLDNNLNVLYNSEESFIDTLTYKNKKYYSNSDANILAENILQNKLAYNASGKIIGTMPNNGTLNYTPNTTQQTIPAGYTSGGSVAGDSNLIPENIKKDISIFDITGTYEGEGGDDVSNYINLNPTGTSLRFTSLITKVPEIDTSSITNMSNAFSSYSGLKEISSLNTSNVTNMYRMFYQCSNLTTIPEINTSKVTNMESMFDGCSNLTTIPQIDTSKVTNMESMFDNCSKLTTIPQIDTSKTKTTERMFFSCRKLTTIPQLDMSNNITMRQMFNYCESLVSISLINTSNVTNMVSTFSGCSSLTTIIGLDTSNATNIYGLFGDCSSLTTIPEINTSSATTTGYMFKGCSNLTTIPEINTSKVQDMNYMFSDCTSLTTIPQIDTSKVENMSYMFDGCSKLETVPMINTSNVTNMYQMFRNCTNLTTIPKINTSNVTNMDYMFNFCNNLTTIPQLNMNNVSSMSSMFNDCVNLSNDSLNNILASLLTATSYTGTKTLNRIGLSSTQATTCTTLSNWSACEAAGWTTGY